MEKLDPAQYEIFRHRLFNILEEGRIAIKMVSGSPVVVEGGETMCAFYSSDGTPILAAAGVLLHCTGAADFIRRCIEAYKDDPGIYDGDQFFYNDPYIGGQHLPDMVVIKPIFFKDKLIAWTGSIMHTAETGGIGPGGMIGYATEIYQEGIRILGLKVVEKGKFRPDIYNTIVQQVRDPHLVGLDTRAKIAANNVCARSYLKLIETYGLDFITAASKKIIEDSELMARARLRSMPDGTWRARHYGDTTGLGERPYKIVCAMTKEGDELTFDFTGSSPQNEGSLNCTLPGTWGNIFVPLASQLFWNVPWNGGMFAAVKLIAPEGTVVNCKYPAAVSQGVVGPGSLIEQAAASCIAKMLYAGGYYEDVNSGWGMAGGAFFGGVNQYGHPAAGNILDTFAAGAGATPSRDGVHTAGQMMNPTSCISDVEIIELNLPFMYLGRRHATDSGGYGKYAGGIGGESAYMAYGTNVLRMGKMGTSTRTEPTMGLFGGYPPAFVRTRFARNTNITEWFKQSRCPRTAEEMAEMEGEITDVPASSQPYPMKQYDVMTLGWSPGGGYGDPLDRDSEAVRQDLIDEMISTVTAEQVYGVIVKGASAEIDREATEARRAQIRQERLKEGRYLR